MGYSNSPLGKIKTKKNKYFGIKQTSCHNKVSDFSALLIQPKNHYVVKICQDLRFSARFPNNPWSYEACATPPPPVYAAPQAPLASFTAPHPHPHPAPVPSYPVQSGAFTSGAGYHGGFNGNFGLLILELSSHMVNIFQSLPTVPQEAVPTP